MPAGQMTETIVQVPTTPSPTPAPSPAPPSSPPATPTKTTTAAPAEDGGDMESAFTKLESRYSTKPAAKEPGEKKPDDKKGEPAKPATAAKPTDKTVPPKEDRQFQEGPKQLREKLEATSKERDESISKIKQYEAKIAEYESKGKDTTALTEQLEREQKEKESLLAEIRVLKKEVSPEFKERWDKPFEKVVGRALEAVKSLTVMGEIDPDTGERKSPDRAATWDDFQLLYSMPINKAIDASLKMFSRGDASVVEHYLTKLKEMDLERNEARNEEREKWKQNESQEIAKQAQQKERFTKASEKTRQDLINSHPDWYDEDPSDPDGNLLLKEGREYLEYQPKTEEEAVRTYERNKLNAIAFPRMAERVKKLTEKVAELEAQIAETKDSSPGTTRRATQGAPATSEKSWEQEMKEAAQG
jgi:hypothetical protein